MRRRVRAGDQSILNSQRIILSWYIIAGILFHARWVSVTSVQFIACTVICSYTKRQEDIEFKRLLGIIKTHLFLMSLRSCTYGLACQDLHKFVHFILHRE